MFFAVVRPQAFFENKEARARSCERSLKKFNVLPSVCFYQVVCHILRGLLTKVKVHGKPFLGVCCLLHTEDKGFVLMP